MILLTSAMFLLSQSIRSCSVLIASHSSFSTVILE